MNYESYEKIIRFSYIEELIEFEAFYVVQRNF